MSDTYTVAAACGPVIPSARIRNVALIGHEKSGKTSVAAALTGVDTAATDAHTTRLRCYTSHHDGLALNVMDPPGHPDFAGDVRAALHVADAAIFVVSASGGMDAATQLWWRECDALELPRAVAVTKLDGLFADFDETAALCQRLFDPSVTSAYLPLLGDDGNAVAGLIGLLSTSVYDYSHGLPPRVSAPESVHLDGIAEARTRLIETILAHSDSDAWVDAYLAGEQVDTEAMVGDLESAIARGELFPVIPIDPVTHVGIDALGQLIREAFGSPSDRVPPAAVTHDGFPATVLSVDPDEPAVAQVVSAHVDSDGDTVGLVRVFAGTIADGATVRFSRPDGSHTDGRITQLRTPSGSPLSHCGAGDMCTIVSPDLRPADTISDPEAAVQLTGWAVPQPQFPVAVTNDPAMRRTLSRHVAVDPSARLEADPDTGQLLLWGLGEVHAEAVVARAAAHGTVIEMHEPASPRRETFTEVVHGTGTYRSGVDAIECAVVFEPRMAGEGIKISDAADNSSPHMDRMRAALRAALSRGVADTNPIIDVHVRVEAITVEGEPHGAEPFEFAARHALSDAATGASIAVLDPIDTATITVPNEYARPVLDDVKTQDGHVRDSTDNGDGLTTITVDLAAAKLMAYAPRLRSLTAGSGRFSREFDRYAPAAIPDGEV